MVLRVTSAEYRKLVLAIEAVLWVVLGGWVVVYMYMQKKLYSYLEPPCSIHHALYHRQLQSPRGMAPFLIRISGTEY
jgi:hypothetical protein